MRTFWITLTRPIAQLSISAESEEQARLMIADLTSQGKPLVRSIESLPYPATPRLIDSAELAKPPVCPPFCSTPGECKGHTSCPHAYACSE